MNVLIKEAVRGSHGGFHVHAACGNVEAYVGFSRVTGVGVCCMNASNRVWKKAGRTFPSVAAALEGYKSGEMKAIIGAAKDALEADTYGKEVAK